MSFSPIIKIIILLIGLTIIANAQNPFVSDIYTADPTAKVFHCTLSRHMILMT